VFSKKFISKNRLPDKAIDIIDAAASRNNLKPEEERSDIITEEHIIDEISHVTKIPVAKITEKQTDKIKNLESNLKQSIFGQNEAIEALVDRIYVSQAGLKDSTRPDAIFMFNGPTGVGKTELAKKLAECLDMSFIRIDMSEYMEKHSVSKLIGAPPGYVGFNDGKIGNGLLINYIEDNPFSVVLFDEVEKAHPDVWNIFLQIFDYGSLTSSNGKKVSFSNSIIIMTSNIGSRYVGKLQIGFNREETGAEIQDEMVKNSLPPELINRIDQIITFNHLDNDVINMIIDKFIKELEIKLQNKNVNIVLTEKAREYLIEKGYNRVFGARPMKRLIDSKISTKLARKILFDNVDDQKMTFTIDVVQNDIVVL
jgi:ATP-dependent Clp protease ATP-binding subunit ClpA